MRARMGSSWGLGDLSAALWGVGWTEWRGCLWRGRGGQGAVTPQWDPGAPPDPARSAVADTRRAVHADLGLRS